MKENVSIVTQWEESSIIYYAANCLRKVGHTISNLTF